MKKVRYDYMPITSLFAGVFSPLFLPLFLTICFSDTGVSGLFLAGLDSEYSWLHGGQCDLYCSTQLCGLCKWAWLGSRRIWFWTLKFNFYVFLYKNVKARLFIGTNSGMIWPVTSYSGHCHTLDLGWLHCIVRAFIFVIEK